MRHFAHGEAGATAEFYDVFVCVDGADCFDAYGRGMEVGGVGDLGGLSVWSYVQMFLYLCRFGELSG